MSEIICGKTMDGVRFVVWTNASIYVNKTNTLLCEVESSAFVQVKRCFRAGKTVLSVYHYGQ